MKTDAFIRNALEEWAADVPPPAGLADRALRIRTRRRRTSAALAVGSAVLLAGAGVAFGVGVHREPRPAAPAVDTSLHTDTAHTPPRYFVAAGRIAISAYRLPRERTLSGGGKALSYQWSLYQPSSGEYRQVPWAWLDVAPGLRRAAVLAGPLPARRVGILDMRTQRVTRWIPLGRGAGGVSWSPDGRRLLVTTYSADPDAGHAPQSRTGFAIVDAGSGEARYHDLAPDREDLDARQDLRWSRDGTLVSAPHMTKPARTFYDLNGDPRPAPPHELDPVEEAGLSPNGRLQAVQGERYGAVTMINDLKTGRRIGVLPYAPSFVWADDTHIIVLACPKNDCPAGGNVFRSGRYTLVNIDGKTLIPLTGFGQGSGRFIWMPVFTHR